MPNTKWALFCGRLLECGRIHTCQGKRGVPEPDHHGPWDGRDQTFILVNGVLEGFQQCGTSCNLRFEKISPIAAGDAAAGGNLVPCLRHGERGSPSAGRWGSEGRGDVRSEG